MDETSWKICDFLRTTSGRGVGVTALQIAEGAALNLGQVYIQIHRLVVDGYIRRLYVRPPVYQWTGRPLSVLPPSQAGDDLPTKCY
ncbi:hypothetical protein [Burkholderia ambifaria]|uniref:hypothetical protein n=1 Tax=Burkholderia ambifaria TaxID=152480 RepID=UPI00158DC026|nr:hypothetical protein [Burkholderia ambifaria]